MPGVDTVRAVQGDTLDGLLWRERALGPEALDAVFAANPNLGTMGAVLPLGTPVVVPAAVPTERTVAVIELWD